MTKVEDIVKSQPLAVGVGTKVIIEVNGEPQEWEIVEVGNSDISNGKISRDAPLIQCILGAKEGDKISCKIVNDNATIIIRKVSVLPQDV
jgi:transcription elongation GreA/GreB family factor